MYISTDNLIPLTTLDIGSMKEFENLIEVYKSGSKEFKNSDIKTPESNPSFYKFERLPLPSPIVSNGGLGGSKSIIYIKH